PAQAEPVAGVYLHAAAANTLLQAPLFTLTEKGRGVADLLIALVPILFVLVVRVLNGGGIADHSLWPDRLMIGTAIAVFVVGFLWIAFTGILWLDYLMVVAALLFHGPVEHLVETVLHAIRRT